MAYFIPGLRSKYLTIELLTFTFDKQAQVIIFLRSLSTKSRNFLGQFREEILRLFDVSPLALELPLRADEGETRLKELIRVLKSYD